MDSDKCIEMLMELILKMNELWGKKKNIAIQWLLQISIKQIIRFYLKQDKVSKLVSIFTRLKS